MKVLFTTGFNYLPQSSGGAESSTHELCLAVAEQGWEPAVLCSLKPNMDWCYIQNRFKNKLFKQSAPHDQFHGYKVFRGWDAVESLEEVCEKYLPDIIVVQSGAPAKLTNKALSLGIKTILYIRDVEYGTHGGEYQNHPLLSVIANSGFTSQSFYKAFGIESVVIPPTIKPKKYDVTSLSSKRNKAVFINPHPLKGVELAIQLATINPDIDFLFVESWHLEPEMKSKYFDQATKLPNVEWLSRQSDMRNVYRHAKVVIAPSVWEEAWGRIATEAHVSGIPVIGSNRGGLPESIGQGGVTLPYDDITQWDEQIKLLFNDADAYEKLAEKAHLYGRREEIQPSYLTKCFIEHLRNRVEENINV